MADNAAGTWVAVFADGRRVEFHVTERPAGNWVAETGGGSWGAGDSARRAATSLWSDEDVREILAPDEMNSGERVAYQRGVVDEREACLRIAIEAIARWKACQRWDAESSHREIGAVEEIVDNIRQRGMK